MIGKRIEFQNRDANWQKESGVVQHEYLSDGNTYLIVFTDSGKLLHVYAGLIQSIS